MTPDDLISETRTLYETRWPTFGDCHNVLVYKDDRAWVLSGESTPGIALEIMQRTTELPPPPWQAVGSVGTGYVELHDHEATARGRAGNLASSPTERTFHCLIATVHTPEGTMTVAWKAEIDAGQIHIGEILTVMDHPSGEVANALVALGSIGGIR